MVLVMFQLKSEATVLDVSETPHHSEGVGETIRRLTNIWKGRKKPVDRYRAGQINAGKDGEMKDWTWLTCKSERLACPAGFRTGEKVRV